jgi:hypothetical protein
MHPNEDLLEEIVPVGLGNAAVEEIAVDGAPVLLDQFGKGFAITVAVGGEKGTAVVARDLLSGSGHFHGSQASHTPSYRRTRRRFQRFFMLSVTHQKRKGTWRGSIPTLSPE